MTANTIQRVRLPRGLRSTQTGFVFPAGTTGTLLEYNSIVNRFFIDFGVAGFAQMIDPRSDAYEFVDVTEVQDA